jgi:hypothetical protein
MGIDGHEKIGRFYWNSVGMGSNSGTLRRRKSGNTGRGDSRAKGGSTGAPTATQPLGFVRIPQAKVDPVVGPDHPPQKEPESFGSTGPLGIGEEMTEIPAMDPGMERGGMDGGTNQILVPSKESRQGVAFLGLAGFCGCIDWMAEFGPQTTGVLTGLAHKP